MRHYRDLAADECGLARDFLAQMDLEDQVHHFQQAMSEGDFDDWEMRATNHHLIGCFDHDILVGMAEIAHDADHAECSLYVDAAHRGKGIGTALFERACLSAHERGADHLTILVTRGDAVMLDMAVRHDGLSVFQHGKSMILPEGDHAMARWLVFNLDEMSPESWFSGALRSVREHLGL
jgi:GNAT superfamily N-acetyltransferase